MTVNFQKKTAKIAPSGVQVQASPKAEAALAKAGIQLQEQKPVEQQPVGVQVVLQAANAIEAKTIEFVNLHKQLEDLGAFEMLKSYDAIKKVLAAHVKETAEDTGKPYVLSCAIGDVEFSKCTNETVFPDKQKVKEALGDDTFMAVVKIGMTEAKKYLTTAQLSALSTTQPGSRSLSSVTYKHAK